jgi:hypothetical protein
VTVLGDGKKEVTVEVEDNKGQKYRQRSEKGNEQINMR